EPAKTEEQFQNLCGRSQGTLADWFARPAADWETLRPVVLERNRFNWRLRARESLRALKRVRRPGGLHIVLFGSDGSGKSTLLALIRSEERRVGKEWRYGGS